MSARLKTPSSRPAGGGGGAPPRGRPRRRNRVGRPQRRVINALDHLRRRCGAGLQGRTQRWRPAQRRRQTYATSDRRAHIYPLKVTHALAQVCLTCRPAHTRTHTHAHTHRYQFCELSDTHPNTHTHTRLKVFSCWSRARQKIDACIKNV